LPSHSWKIVFNIKSSNELLLFENITILFKSCLYVKGKAKGVQLTTLMLWGGVQPSTVIEFFAQNAFKRASQGPKELSFPH